MHNLALLKSPWKFLDPNSYVDDFQNLISSFLSRDILQFPGSGFVTMGPFLSLSVDSLY